MRRTPAKKAWFVAATAVALVGLFVATALAAPVLQPGVTSAPGMSGVCTDCHVYATPPATPPVVTPPPTTPPVVTPPPATNPPSAGEGHESDNDDKAEVKKAEKKSTKKVKKTKKAKKHSKKARSHKHD